MMGFLLFYLSLFFLGIFISWLFTKGLIWIALKKNIVDVPNHRSSHTKITARGGGLSFVILYLLFLVFLIAEALYRTATMIRLNALSGAPLMSLPLLSALIPALLVGGALVAVIGYLDDRYNLTARIRVIVHFSAAIFVVYFIGYIAEIKLLGIALPLGFIGALLTALFIVWMINLYNFMDGIDGLSAMEALYVLLALTVIVITWLQFNHHDLPTYLFWQGEIYLFLALIPLMAFVTGFLLLNFPPAKIFMGDAGSGFLGFTLGVIALYCAKRLDPDFLWIGLILLGVFIVDATWTLIVRLIHKQKVFEAHRIHAYQYAARRFNSHKKVTLSILAVNVFWLFPMALLVTLQKMDGFLALCIAYAPLIYLCVYFKAGKPENS